MRRRRTDSAVRRVVLRGQSWIKQLMIAVSLVLCVFFVSTAYVNRLLQEQAASSDVGSKIIFKTVFWKKEEYSDVADFKDDLQYHLWRQLKWQTVYALSLLHEVRNQYKGITDETRKPMQLHLDDIEFGEFIGGGMISTVFAADIPKLHGRTKMPLQTLLSKSHIKEQIESPYVARIVRGIEDNIYANLEIEILRWLNVQPRHPSIPKPRFILPNIKSPFADFPLDYLVSVMGLSDSDAKWLTNGDAVVSIHVHERFKHTGGLPKVWDNHDGIFELARFAFSLLGALNFVHNRNIMLSDIWSHNVLYDNATGTAFFPDFNAARVFAPQVLLYQSGQNRDIMPPEYFRNENATHVTVSAFDIWATSILLTKCLCGKRRCPMPSNAGTLVWNVHEIIFLMQNPDPRLRPSASQLLEHTLFRDMSS